MSFLGIGEIGAASINAASSALGQRLQYQYNLKLQQQAQQWQERMSNTAHQREVKDLREAGLNPILSATGGSGASTGSVGAGSVGLPQIDPISSAIAWKQSKNDTNLKESQRDLNKQQADKAQYEADAAHSAAAYQNEQTRQLMEFGPQQAKANINLTNAQAEATRNSAKSQSLYNQDTQQYINWMNKNPKLRNIGNFFKGTQISPNSAVSLIRR